MEGAGQGDQAIGKGRWKGIGREEERKDGRRERKERKKRREGEKREGELSTRTHWNS